MRNPTNTSVAVVVATYNGATYLLAQLESIALQTHKPAQIIIVDDASSDDTVRIANNFAIEHPNVLVVQNETRLGYIKNFEKGMLLATASYVALSDQDDIWVPHKLETLLANIGGQMLAYSDSELIDAEGQLLNQKMSTIKNDLVYRVYDSKNNYHQSYNSFFEDALKWAKSCANRVGGRVDQIEIKDGQEVATTVFTSKNDK